MAPLAPANRDTSRDSEPLTIEEITAYYGPTHRDGDLFTLQCQLNRSMTAFEERLLDERAVHFSHESAGGEMVNIDRRSIEDFDLAEVQSALRRLSALAAEASSESVREINDLLSAVRILNAELKFV